MRPRPYTSPTRSRCSGPSLSPWGSLPALGANQVQNCSSPSTAQRGQELDPLEPEATHLGAARSPGQCRYPLY